MLTFEKIIEPVILLIKEEQNRLKNDEKFYKLSLYYFMVSLIYAVINKTQSIRLLITEIKTNPDLKKLGFVLASPSMYSEAFSRYKPEVFQRIFAKLIEIIEIKDIPEIRNSLFFRCIKRTLDALHLWNHEPNGVKIQFYIYLIVYVLLIYFKQTLVKRARKPKRKPCEF